jgi:nucleotide-binding universal stress UspA family protein
MREEAREQINTHFEEFAEWMRVQQNIEPELVIREGEPIPEIISQVTEDPEVGVLVLGAGTGSDGPGPLVSALTRMASSIPVPVTIISGDMTEERLKAVS